jgi:hypothetical protein
MGTNNESQFRICYREDMFGSVEIDRPIEYSFMTPLPGARRDSDQDARDVSTEIAPKLRNRRLALVLALDEARKRSSNLNVEELKNHMMRHTCFVIQESAFRTAIDFEMKSAALIGALWKLHDSRPGVVTPMSRVNRNVLERGCPKEALDVIHDIVQEESNFEAE